jgi:hypothetical protein
MIVPLPSRLMEHEGVLGQEIPFLKGDNGTFPCIFLCYTPIFFPFFP